MATVKIIVDGVEVEVDEDEYELEQWPDGRPDNAIQKDLDRTNMWIAIVEAHPLLGATIPQTEQWVDNNIPDITNLASAVQANKAIKIALKEIAASIVILRKGVIKLAIDVTEN